MAIVLERTGAVAQLGWVRAGLGAGGALKPCCLGASDSIRFCGDVDPQGKPMFSVCNDAATSLFWDAIHPSQAGWIAITQILFPNAKLGPFSQRSYAGTDPLTEFMTADDEVPDTDTIRSYLQKTILDNLVDLVEICHAQAMSCHI